MKVIFRLKNGVEKLENETTQEESEDIQDTIKAAPPLASYFLALQDVLAHNDITLVIDISTKIIIVCTNGNKKRIEDCISKARNSINAATNKTNADTICVGIKNGNVIIQ